jgi:arsenate reductase (thioredoxin)
MILMYQTEPSVMQNVSHIRLESSAMAMCLRIGTALLACMVSVNGVAAEAPPARSSTFATVGPEAPMSQVLFVCEHGNVKSLMAASYFNQLAQQRGLPFRAVSRGTAPNSDTVPSAIAVSLKSEGFDVSTFHPAAVSAADISSSLRVVTIGTALPAGTVGTAVEQWTDVPAASVDYAAARASLKQHVSALLEQLSKQQ